LEEKRDSPTPLISYQKGKKHIQEGEGNLKQGTIGGRKEKKKGKLEQIPKEEKISQPNRGESKGKGHM